MSLYFEIAFCFFCFLMGLTTEARKKESLINSIIDDVILLVIACLWPLVWANAIIKTFRAGKHNG